LVGKLPNPQAQVEQITIAMIYKFMDDMDKEAMEFGGEATFFTGEFEKYSWTKIFDPKLGGFEMLALYGEAIVKLNQNPIFRNCSVIFSKMLFCHIVTLKH
jgi:type I restriction enzyme M protein